MSKSRDRFQNARLLPRDQEIQKRIASISVRPLRLAFIIDEFIPEQQLVGILQYNCIVWGGYFNVLIPSSAGKIRDDWYRFLVNQDPDFIILCCHLDNEVVERMDGEIQPFVMAQCPDAILENKVEYPTAIRGVSLSHLLVDINESIGPMRHNIRIPLISEESLFYLHSIAQFGMLPKRFRDYCIEMLKGQHLELPKRSLRKYLDSISDLKAMLTPVELTKLHLSTSVEILEHMGFTVVLTSRNPINDLCLFWNLRMQPTFGRNETLLLPISVMKTKRGIEEFAEYCVTSATWTNFIVIASASASKRQLLAIRDRLVPRLKNSKIEHVDLWLSNFALGSISCHQREWRDELAIEDGFFRTKSAPPDLESELNQGVWAMDIGFEAEGRRPMGFVPSKFKTLNKLLSGDPEDWIVRMNRGYNVRLAKRCLSYRVTERTEILEGLIPEDDRVLQALFKNKGYSSSFTDKCRYTKGIAGLLGGLGATGIFRDNRVLSLFDSMVDGSAYTPQEMMCYLKPGSEQRQKDKTFKLVTDLALKRILLRGYKIHCPACDLTFFRQCSHLVHL